MICFFWRCGGSSAFQQNAADSVGFFCMLVLPAVGGDALVQQEHSRLLRVFMYYPSPQLPLERMRQRGC